MKQTCILVLGMHRSGTSALSGVLNILGLNLGRRLMQATDDNPKGYFENDEIFKFNELKLLDKLDTSWDSIKLLDESSFNSIEVIALLEEAKKIILENYENDEFFVIKDPRMSILLPFWKRVLTELNIDLKVIIMYREPLEVAKSINKRDNLSIEYSISLWLKYNILLEKDTRSIDRLYVSFDHLLQDPKRTLESIQSFISINNLFEIDKFKNEIGDFLNKSLKHHNKETSEQFVVPSFFKDFVILINSNLLKNTNNQSFYEQVDKLKEDYTYYFQYFYDETILNLYKYTKEVNIERKNIIVNREQQITDRKEEIKNKELIIEEKDILIDKYKNIIENREEQIADRKKELENKDISIDKFKNIVENREQQIKDKKEELEKKNILIEKYSKIIENREQQIEDRKEDIKKYKELAESRTIKNRIKKLLGVFNFYKKRKKKIELTQTPLVSIIIPFKDKPELLKCVIESVLNKSTYNNFEIIGISNNSCEEKTFQEMNRLKGLDKRVSFKEYNIPFNYSKINNFAVNELTNGEYIVFMNNDIEVISDNWIEALLYEALKPNVGAVGAKLYYENDTIQHAGVSINKNNAPIHVYHQYKRNSSEYRLNNVSEYLAVTAALLMVKKEKFIQVGLFNESLTVAYNDVDMCFNLLKKGYKNIFTPYCEAYHYESLSRGYENTPEKQERLQREKDILISRHREILFSRDPYFTEKGNN